LDGIEQIKLSMEERIRILLLEDSEMDADLLVRHLRKENIDFDHTRVWERAGFREQLYKYDPDIIIADYSLPQFNGMEAFREMKAAGVKLPFILVTGSLSEKLLQQVIKEGVDDYLLKDNLLRLSSAIMNVVYKRQLELQKKKVEERNKDILDSINYAKRIQDAIFPPQELVKELIPESFVLFKPKDIISGDFYWVEKLQNKIFIAAVDCTGHGVPGALLSIVGYNLLSKSINEHNHIKPAEILNELSNGIYKTLRQTGEDAGVKDTMDIALCSIDKSTGSLEFSGAYNSLYHVRNKHLTEIPADRFPIGVFLNGELRKFTNHQMQLKNGDIIYLFSDGYADQFGGPKGKKLKYKQLQKLLVSMQGLSMNDQKNILDSFIEEWKGQTLEEQTDDILIIGIKI
jgi:serine phosphatase RsbU (regulator of sigma subunit)